MNKRLAIALAIMAIGASVVQAATYQSTALANANWTDAGAWGTTPGYPGSSAAGDIAYVSGSATITLNSSVPNTMGNIHVGRSSVGNLIVNSGANMTLSLGNNLTVGSTAVGYYTQNGGTVNGTSALNISIAATTTAGSLATINGGNLNVGTTLFVAKAANGGMDITGGAVKTRDLTIGDALNTTVGTVSLTGGSLEVTSAAFAINTAGSQLEIGTGGTLILGGDVWSTVGNYVNSGDIVWDALDTVTAGVGDKTWHNLSGHGYIHTDYDALTGKTTVWVNQTIPEPATVGMLGLGSLIVLLVRRMRG